MIFDGIFLGDGQLEVSFLFFDPLSEPDHQVDGPVDLLTAVHYGSRVLLLFSHLVLLQQLLAGLELQLNVTDHLLHLLDLPEVALTELLFQLPVPRLFLAHFFLLKFYFGLQISLDLEALLVALLHQCLAIQRVHLHELLGFLVLLIVGAVSGPCRFQDLRVESLCGQLFGQLRVLDQLSLLLVVLMLHDCDGLLPFFQQRCGLIFLHVPYGFVSLVPQILRFLHLEGLIVLEEVYLVIELILPDSLNLIERFGLMLRRFEFILRIFDPLLHEYVDLLQSLLHELQPIGLIPDILQIFLPLVEQLIAVDPGLLGHLLIEDYFFLDLGDHGIGVLDFVLHALVLLEVVVELGLEFGEVVLLLFCRGVDGLHGFEGDLGEGAAIAGLVDVVVEDAHLATVGEVGLDLALDGGLAVDDLEVLDMRLLALVRSGLGLVLMDLLLGLVEGTLALRGLLGEEVVVFVEVHLQLRQRGRFCQQHLSPIKFIITESQCWEIWRDGAGKGKRRGNGKVLG